MASELAPSTHQLQLCSAMANNRRMAFSASRDKRTKMQGKRRVTFDMSSVLLEAAKRDDILEGL